jgi:hypothetical protein
MRRHPVHAISVFAALLSGLALATFSAAADSPDARRTIEQAIAAQGGMKALEPIGATFTASKGTWNELEEATFRGEEFVQAPDRYRQMMNIETQGVLVYFVDVLNGDRCWNRVNKDVSEDTGANLTELRSKVYVFHVASLVPLIQEQGYSLVAEPGQKVNDAPADVILVCRNGKPDVRLFFDQKSHLLVKIQHTRFYPTIGKNAQFETFLSDYRVIDVLEPDRKTLAAAKIEPDGPSLKAFIQKQTLEPKEQTQVQKLIKSLSDDKFAVREEAKNSLIKMGPRVSALLDEATRSPDPEVSSRARESLQALGKGPSPDLLAAVVRAYANAHDPEAIGVLLAYLPCAGDDSVAKEVRSAIAGLAAADPKAREQVMAAANNGHATLRKALASLVAPTGLSGDVGYRVYPLGVKQPMKFVELRDGKKTAEWQVSEMRFYHALSPALFVKP